MRLQEVVRQNLLQTIFDKTICLHIQMRIRFVIGRWERGWPGRGNCSNNVILKKEKEKKKSRTSFLIMYFIGFTTSINHIIIHFMIPTNL